MHADFPPHGDEPGFNAGLPPLYNLVYCSRASAAVDDAAVDRIIATARRANPAQGITGLLVFGGGLFFQWLEGPRQHVQSLMARLQADPRHEQIVVLSETEEVRERLFPDWDMERVGPEHVRDVLADAHDAQRGGEHADTLAELLRQLDAGLLGDRPGA